MAIEVTNERAVCTRCGRAYGKRRGSFYVSHAANYMGTGHLNVCIDCTNKMYEKYLAECKDPRMATRQMCRKLDLYWHDGMFETVSKQFATKSIFSQYLSKINMTSYAGRSYDDTLIEENSLWEFSSNLLDTADIASADGEEGDGISPEVIEYWGVGYNKAMYKQLEKRKEYWVKNLGDGIDLNDIGTQTIIRQICFLELDINRDRAAGRNVDKSINTLLSLLSSANIKPDQKKQDEIDANLEGTPLGVWLRRYEKERPLPEIDEDLKDVNGIRKYVFTWMGHVLKMLGVKNAYSKMYEDEVARLRVDRPEYDDEDDESFMIDLMAGDDHGQPV